MRNRGGCGVRLQRGYRLWRQVPSVVPGGVAIRPPTPGTEGVCFRTRWVGPADTKGLFAFRPHSLGIALRWATWGCLCQCLC